LFFCWESDSWGRFFVCGVKTGCARKSRQAKATRQNRGTFGPGFRIVYGGLQKQVCAGALEGVGHMFSLLFLVVLYFLPAILGRDKSDAGGIFLLNLFLGWTLIGWLAAFIWAIASDRPTYVRYVPAGPGRFCSQALR
jgi:hypothetical protein